MKNATPTAEPVEEITLDEFCLRLSKTDKRVELIGAFHSMERRASKFKDAETAFADRFAKFANQPA